MDYTQELKRDIIEWDIVNWWKFIEFIDQSGIGFEGKKILDIGGRNGGLSLYCALKGGTVVCSDYGGPTPQALSLHRKYHVEKQIQYEEIDATNIPERYNDYFDIVVFKSVIGSVEAHNGKDSGAVMAENIRRVLKPGGVLFFAENMKSTWFHRLFRLTNQLPVFHRWLRKSESFSWVYQDKRSIASKYRMMRLEKENYFGFLACFGIGMKMRCILGNIDTILDRLLPSSWKYIGVFLYRNQ